ncbi:hypothetical protein FPZ42_07665 [Mucilaginibacter achroorhodeus]|uniref:Phage-like element PBSX protein XkdF domain-containing protein n=1 Tax=Mucilaginibacter achroorhodeus TaxID=2599294 RepID=A0A563U6F1_9SPHI|nr:XkdF-like putative serine protease domain-containing protein [Mucilaginibacter achroorhodeus]TWR26903.1 hypothetical protein FPZ42_07665 [Mucilaginibacter achroorhodeus]
MLDKKLPLIELQINPEDNSFVSAIALVENPAIESDFIAFSTAQEYFSVNDEKKELLGLALIPDKPIYRNSPETGEYACVFSKTTIRQISQVFAKKGLFSNTNIEHTLIPADSYIFQSYITDEAKNINAPNGIKAPDGSWVIGVKVEDEAVWNNIKAGKIKGFSVEGIFKLLDTNKSVSLTKSDEPETLINDFLDSLKALIN